MNTVGPKEHRWQDSTSGDAAVAALMRFSFLEADLAEKALACDGDGV